LNVTELPSLNTPITTSDLGCNYHPGGLKPGGIVYFNRNCQEYRPVRMPYRVDVHVAEPECVSVNRIPCPGTIEPLLPRPEMGQQFPNSRPFPPRSINVSNGRPLPRFLA
jgi:hypothetical protein